MSLETPHGLSYTMHNNLGAETIVLIHGGFSKGTEWDQVIPKIGQEYHILVPDLPGHGASSHLPFDVERSAKLVLDLITTLAHKGRAHVVGFSLGAHVAAYVAELAAPGQVSSLITTGYNAFAPPPVIVPFLGVLIYVVSHFVIGFTDPKAQWDVWVSRSCTLTLSGAVVRTLCNGRALGRIDARSLIIAATGGTFTPKDKVDSSRDLFQVVEGGLDGGNRVVQHRGVKHPWHVSHPDLFARTVLEWVEGEKLSGSFEDIDL